MQEITQQQRLCENNLLPNYKYNSWLYNMKLWGIVEVSPLSPLFLSNNFQLPPWSILFEQKHEFFEPENDYP